MQVWNGKKKRWDYRGPGLRDHKRADHIYVLVTRGIKMYQKGEKEIQKTGSISQESEKTRKEKHMKMRSSPKTVGN